MYNGKIFLLIAWCFSVCLFTVHMYKYRWDCSGVFLCRENEVRIGGVSPWFGWYRLVGYYVLLFELFLVDWYWINNGALLFDFTRFVENWDSKASLNWVVFTVPLIGLVLFGGCKNYVQDKRATLLWIAWQFEWSLLRMLLWIKTLLELKCMDMGWGSACIRKLLCSEYLIVKLVVYVAVWVFCFWCANIGRLRFVWVLRVTYRWTTVLNVFINSIDPTR